MVFVRVNIHFKKLIIQLLKPRLTNHLANTLSCWTTSEMTSSFLKTLVVKIFVVLNLSTSHIQTPAVLLFYDMQIRVETGAN